MTRAEQVKKSMNVEKGKPEILSPDMLLSTGSTLLNLACSGHVEGGFCKGRVMFLVGDSRSGKTFLSLTCFAEAKRHPKFKRYRTIFDDVEGGALMDAVRFFGPDAAASLEPPATWADGSPKMSRTVEEFYFNLDTALAHKRPCIYVLDSMDAISSDDEVEKFAERKAAAEKGKETTGTYGTSKARANSDMLRQVIPKLKNTGSILIVISQTRDNIGFGAKFQPKTRSGGRALRFYATLEMWSSIVGKIKVRHRGKDRQQGIIAKVVLEKNRLNGRETSIEMPIYWSHGIDDIGGCVNWLVEEKVWKEKGELVIVPDWDVAFPKEELVQYIEAAGLEDDLRKIVGKAWKEIEAACEVKRKPRYG